MLQFIESISSFVKAQIALKTKKEIPTISIRNDNFFGFPLFENFLREENVENLAGPAELAQMFRPIEFTLVPDSVHSLEEFTAVGLHFFSVMKIGTSSY